MTILNDCVSSCCGAKMRVEGGDVGSMATTMYYVCTECGQPCNWKQPNAETLQALKDSRERKNLISADSVKEMMENCRE